MSPAREVRIARAGDEAAIAALAGQLGYPTSAESVAARLEALGGRGDLAVFVAVEGKEHIVGWAQVGLVEYVYHEAFAELLGLVVEEKERGRGLGSSLVAAAEAWARERGVGTLSLRSNVVRTEAHAFYEGLGFSRTKTSYTFRKSLAV